MENVGGNNLEVAPADEEEIEKCATNGFTAGQIIGVFETAKEGPGRQNGVDCWKVDKNIDRHLGDPLGVFYNRPYEFFIKNYPAFRLRRHECFYRYLIGHRYFQKVAEGQYTRHDFACDKTALKRLFIIPIKKYHDSVFEFCARRLDGVIFIEQPNTRLRQRTNEGSHQGAVYARRVTGQRVSKCFDDHIVRRLIREVTFRPNDNNDIVFRLLLTDDAYVNHSGEGVEIKAINSTKWNPDDLDGVERLWLEQKYLKYYRNMAVIGAQELVLGHRDEKGVLRKNEKLGIEEVWGRTTAPERGREKCHEFLGRLFQWLKQQFQDDDDDESKVVKFWLEEIESESDTPRSVIRSEDITNRVGDLPLLWNIIAL